MNYFYKKYLPAAVLILGLSAVGIKLTLDKNAMDSFHFSINVPLVQPLYAATDNSSNWDGVRGVATFSRDLIKGIDTFILKLVESGVLANSAVVTHNNGTAKIKIDPNANATVTSAAFGAKTYKIRVDFWSAANDSKVMELFFDDPATRNDVLIIWRPKFFDASLGGNDIKFECAMTGGSKNGKMICSWGGGPIDTAGAIDNARIYVQADSAKNRVNVRALARVATTATAACPLGAGTHTTRDYYNLAFIANIDKPNYTTASFGIAETAGNISNALVCTTANPYNYGYFNTSVFAGNSDSKKFYHMDQVPGTNAADDKYPAVADVATLHATIGSDTDMTITAIDALAISFNSAAAPGF